MSLASVFTTTVTTDQPTNGNVQARDASENKTVSDFITVQSFANFSVMTGAFTAAWGAAQQIGQAFHGRWFPLILCLAFGAVSFVASKPTRDSGWYQALLITFVNSLVLFGAVLGAGSLAPGVTD